jgi:hypothetical protein
MDHFDLKKDDHSDTDTEVASHEEEELESKKDRGTFVKRSDFRNLDTVRKEVVQLRRMRKDAQRLMDMQDVDGNVHTWVPNLGAHLATLTTRLKYMVMQHALCEIEYLENC